jgi:hypothetical protein
MCDIRDIEEFRRNERNIIRVVEEEQNRNSVGMRES